MSVKDWTKFKADFKIYLIISLTSLWILTAGSKKTGKLFVYLWDVSALLHLLSFICTEVFAQTWWHPSREQPWVFGGTCKRAFDTSHLPGTVIALSSMYCSTSNAALPYQCFFGVPGCWHSWLFQHEHQDTWAIPIFCSVLICLGITFIYGSFLFSSIILPFFPKALYWYWTNFH